VIHYAEIDTLSFITLTAPPPFLSRPLWDKFTLMKVGYNWHVPLISPFHIHNILKHTTYLPCYRDWYMLPATLVEFSFVRSDAKHAELWKVCNFSLQVSWVMCCLVFQHALHLKSVCWMRQLKSARHSSFCQLDHIVMKRFQLACWFHVSWADSNEQSPRNMKVLRPINILMIHNSFSQDRKAGVDYCVFCMTLRPSLLYVPASS
jgi:hypothetical protein